MQSLRLCSWNVHRGRGRRGPVCKPRLMKGLASLPSCDVLVLQEADTEAFPPTAILDTIILEKETGLRSVHDRPGRLWGQESAGFHGIVVLARPDLVPDTVDLVDLPGICHRGAVVAVFDGFRVIGTHLSLGQPARIGQMRTIGQYLSRKPVMPTILAGDMNEWRPWGGLAFSRQVTGMALEGPARRTFPAGWPVLPLDRVLAGQGAHVRSLDVVPNPFCLQASDHRPALAEIALDDGVR